MSAGEWAAVVLSVTTAVLAGGLVVTLWATARTLVELRRTAAALREQLLPAVTELHTAAARANEELDRVDGLLDTAESVGETVERASRVAVLALGNPLVKAAAMGAGVARASQRLREGPPPRRRTRRTRLAARRDRTITLPAARPLAGD